MQARASPKAFKRGAEALMADTGCTTPGHLPSSMLPLPTSQAVPAHSQALDFEKWDTAVVSKLCQSLRGTGTAG